MTYKTQLESTKLRCKKGLSTLKAVAAKGIGRHLFLLYQSVILSVIDYGLGLTTLSTVQPTDAGHGTKRSQRGRTVY